MLAITSSCFQIHLCKIYKYRWKASRGISRSSITSSLELFFFFSCCFFSTLKLSLYKSFPLLLPSLRFFLLNDEKDADSHFNLHFPVLPKL